MDRIYPYNIEYQTRTGHASSLAQRRHLDVRPGPDDDFQDWRLDLRENLDYRLGVSGLYHDERLHYFLRNWIYESALLERLVAYAF